MQYRHSCPNRGGCPPRLRVWCGGIKKQTDGGGDVKRDFGRVLTAMITPYTESGEVAYDKAAELARHLVKTGSDGIVVSGTTGEAPVLTD